MRKLSLLGGFIALGLLGCDVEVEDGSRGEDPNPEPPPTGETKQPLTTDKVDLLLVIDNSVSMADKQQVLAPSVVKLVRDLTNPPCIDANGVRLPDAQQPASPADACPAGSTRAGAAVTDLRVGLISSSLGALGAGQCDGGVGANPTHNDAGRLLSRTITGGNVPTYQDLGFLAWDPQGILSPPGDASLADFEAKLTDMVIGVDEVGCGYEMPLEAMTRFLVDPAPYATLTPDGQGYLVPQGVDNELLAQRDAFIRPDSLVSVVLLADENDCSIDVRSQGWLMLGASPFYKATSACESDPNDACCTSCALPVPEGCAPDPACGAQGGSGAAKYTQLEDHPNLRCWDQKRRYGMDFQYPVARYTNALTQAEIDPTASDYAVTGETAIPNPLFWGGRPASFVTLTTVVGVPWQDLATDPTDPQSPNKSTLQMEADGSWAWLVSGADPFMVESIAPRSGVNPATGAAVGSANAINGGDRSLVTADDLQYTCIFGLPSPAPDSSFCGDCTDATCDDPICDGTTLVGAKAYPGIRQLELVRSLEGRGIAGSICPSEPLGSSPSEPVQRATNYDRPIMDLEARMWTMIAPRQE